MAFSWLATDTSIFYSMNIWCDIFSHWKLFRWVSPSMQWISYLQMGLLFPENLNASPYSDLYPKPLPVQTKHFSTQVCLFKERLSSQLLKWENLIMSWLEDPKRPLIEEMRKEARDHERLARTHRELSVELKEVIHFHSVFYKFSHFHRANSNGWDRGTNSLCIYY